MVNNQWVDIGKVANWLNVAAYYAREEEQIDWIRVPKLSLIKYQVE